MVAKITIPLREENLLKKEPFKRVEAQLSVFLFFLINSQVIDNEPQYLIIRTKTDLSLKVFLRFQPNPCLDVLIKL